MPVEQLYRTILVLDIEQFGHPGRDDQVRVQLRRDLLGLLTGALTQAGIASAAWSATNTGDGLLVLIDPSVVETARVIGPVLDNLTAALVERNRISSALAVLRVRAVVHAGHVMLDAQGVTGEQVILAFRLLDADVLRAHLKAVEGPLVVAVSAMLYEQVVRHRHLGLDPDVFSSVTIKAKETSAKAWLHAPSGSPTTSSQPHSLRRADSGSVVVPYRGLASFDVADAAWFFGRERLTELLVSRLLARLAGPSLLLLVVGASGSGKSSLLHAGLLSTLARGELPGSDTWPVVVCTPGPRPVTELAVRLAPLAQVTAGAVVDELTADPGRLALLVRQAVTVQASRAVATTALRKMGHGLAPAGDANRSSGNANKAAQGGARGGAPGTDARLVLLVDQFEELFTVCTDPAERRRFIDGLCAVAGNPTTQTHGLAPVGLVVIGVRADFYARCAADPGLAPLLHDGQVVVGPMTSEELRQAIEQPAKAAGLALEPGLVEVLLHELDLPPGDPSGAAATGERLEGGGYEAGVLPLLSHALLATWQQRESDRLTIAGYRATGGIHGAVAATAEAIYEQLDQAGQDKDTARRLLVRLVTLGEGVADARRRASLTELIGDEPGLASGSLARVLDRFVQGRLVTVDAGHAELTHEALLRAWPRLRGWLDADRAGLRLHHQLTEAARSWVDANRDESGLYRGARLAAVREWVADPRHRDDLSPLERDFLERSIQRETDEQQAAARITRRLRWRSRILAVLLVLAVVASGIAIQQARTARQQRRTAISQRVTTRADLLRTADPALALQLNLVAWRIAPTPQARAGLLTAFSHPYPRRLSYTDDPSNSAFPVFGAVSVFSPDRRLLATGGRDDGTVQLWDVEKALRLATIAGPSDAVSAMAFSPDGRILATGSGDASGDQTVRLWDIRHHVYLPPFTGHADSITAMAFSPDGRILATGSSDQTVQLWDMIHHRRLATLTVAGSVGAVTFSPDGRTLATGSNKDGEDRSSGAVRLWDVAKGVRLATLTRDIGLVNAVAFSPDGRTLAVGSSDEGGDSSGGAVRLWDVAKGVRLATLTRDIGPVSAVAFSPDGRMLATGTSVGGSRDSSDGAVRLWNLADSSQLTTVITHADTFDSLVLSPDGRILATSGYSGGVLLWDTVPPPDLTSLAGGIGGESVVLSPDGHTLAISSLEGNMVRLWDVARGVRLATLSDHAGPIRSVAFSPDGRVLVANSRDGMVRLWDVAKGTALAAIIKHDNPFVPPVLSPDGHTLATSSLGDDTVRLWDVVKGTRVATLTGNVGLVGAVVFSPDGRTLAIGSGDGVRLWDMTRHAQLATVIKHGDPIAPVAFSPDGRNLVTSSTSDGNGSDGTVRLWDVAKRRQEATLTGHIGSVDAVVFSPDGRTLASGGGNEATVDGIVQLWDVASHTQLATLASEVRSILTLTFSPDGRALGLVGYSGTQPAVRLWHIDTRQVVAQICANAGILITKAEWALYFPDLPYKQICP